MAHTASCPAQPKKAIAKHEREARYTSKDASTTKSRIARCPMLAVGFHLRI